VPPGPTVPRRATPCAVRGFGPPPVCTFPLPPQFSRLIEVHFRGRAWNEFSALLTSVDVDRIPIRQWQWNNSASVPIILMHLQHLDDAKVILTSTMLTVTSPFNLVFSQSPEGTQGEDTKIPPQRKTLTKTLRPHPSAGRCQ